MPVYPSIEALAAQITEWRHHLHAHPELMYDTHETAGFVAGKLREFGVDDIATGIGRTGVVGLIRGRAQKPGPMIGLRADMDALPITETSGKPHASQYPGKMHACGHDGHTAMLLGAARYLCETRHFAGAVALVFQPAEEGGAGARAMIEDGLFERFPVDQIYGMHNMPGLDIGRFAIRTGTIMAAADFFSAIVEGRGGHAAQPNRTIDPVCIAAQCVTALQSIVSRTIDPLDAAVVSVTKFHAGEAGNVIPDTACFGGTVRTLDADTRKQVAARIKCLLTQLGAGLGAKVSLDYSFGYPPVVNREREAGFASQVASDISGEGNVDTDCEPVMGGEDFAYYLEKKPGAFIFAGNGDSPALHNSGYDFCDDLIIHGSSFWARLVEAALPE